MIQALGSRDGLVQDAKVQRSVPGLDDAALTAARRWLFKPATFKGKLIAVWTVIPIKFSLP